MDYFPFIYEKKKPANEPLPLYKELEIPQYYPILPKKEESEKIIIIEL